MNDDFWKLKIKAYLHDPPQKAIIMMTGVSHEEPAKQYIRMLIGDDEIPASVRDADRMAAATTRPVVEAYDDQTGIKHQPSIVWCNKPELINPLSGESYDLSRFGKLVRWDLFNTAAERIKDTAAKAVEDELQQIKKDSGNDYRKMYFALWRLLAENLCRSTPDDEARLGLLWRYLPADTRVPDHSIWDHASMTAALAGALPNPAFLLFSIGPVQSYIATARRTQDLWMGSYILSFLTWSALKEVVLSFGPDTVIFPGLEGQPLFDHWLNRQEGIGAVSLPDADALKVASFPNRFLALLPAEKTAEAGQACRRAVEEVWKTIYADIKGRLEAGHGDALAADPVWNDLWINQSEGFFETYWVSLPWAAENSATTPESADNILQKYRDLLGNNAIPPDFEAVYQAFKKARGSFVNTGTCYQLLYDLAERAHGARKAVRDFPPKAEHGYKCTLCGEREALHPQKAVDGAGSLEQSVRNFWSAMAERLGGSHLRRGGGERLCAPCAVKRLAALYFGESYFDKDIRFGERFPSVSSIAVAPFQIGVLQADKNEKDTKLQSAVRDFVAALQAIDKDAFFHAGCVEQAWRLRKKSALGDTAEKFLRIDGDYLFKDGLTQEKLEKELGIKPDPEALENAVRTLDSLLSLAGDRDPPLVPSSYAAVLHLDGDDMGRWLTGEKAPRLLEAVHTEIRQDVKKILGAGVNYRRPMSPALHTAVSNALRDYAIHLVRTVVEEWHPGQLIYSGGDDVLALLPKESAVPAAADLRLVYSGNEDPDKTHVKSGGGFVYREKDKDGGLYRLMGGKASLSGGIALVHHSHSLQEAVRLSRELEEHAKGWHDGENRKNALCLASVTRSGETRRAVLPFAAPAEQAAVKIIDLFRDSFAAGWFSPTFIRALADEQEGLSVLPFSGNGLLRKRARYLVGRNIISEKLEPLLPPGAGKDELDTLKQQKQDELTDIIMQLAALYAGSAPSGQSARDNPLESALNVIRLALFLAREVRP